MSFLKQVNSAITKIEARIDGNVGKIAADLHSRIVAKTPVDSGELRRSWVMTKIPKGYSISTGVPYAPVVEYGLYPNPPKSGKGKTEGGYSKQAPQGMVRTSIKEVANKWK